MKIAIMYYSFTGITRKIAEELRDACEGEIIEIQPKKRYSMLSVMTRGILRARRLDEDDISPDPLDVSAYDLLVIGTPVWGRKPTPVINGAIASLVGAEGKKAVVYVTCGSPKGSGDSVGFMKDGLEKKGVEVTGQVILGKEEIESSGASELIKQVKKLG